MSRALVISAEDFEDFEFGYPYYRLQEAENVEVDVATPDGEEVEGEYGYSFDADLKVEEVEVSDYDAVVLPGANSPENLRMNCEEAIGLVERFDEEGKVVASVCHAAQVLISAGIVEDRDATCWWGVMDDLEAAGANVKDRSVVVDGNLVTSRCPDDLPDFMREVLGKLE